MKNQYFGDVDDYRKYGLLRILHRVSVFRIGVCWCLTVDDGGAHGENRSHFSNVRKCRATIRNCSNTLRRLNDPSLPRSVALGRDWDIVAAYFESVRSQRYLRTP